MKGDCSLRVEWRPGRVRIVVVPPDGNGAWIDFGSDAAMGVGKNIIEAAKRAASLEKDELTEVGRWVDDMVKAGGSIR